MTAMMLAHQGGWDEVLLVMAPLALLAVVLWIANKRASALDASERAETDDDDAARPL